MRNVVVFILMAVCSASMSQDAKEQKKTIKSLRKRYKLEYANYMSDKGFAYIKMGDKSGNVMVADSDGNILVPNACQGGKTYIDIWYENFDKIASKPFVMGSSNKPVFVALAKGESGRCYDFFTSDGSMLSTIDGLLVADKNVNAYIWHKDGKCGMVSKDGNIICPAEYSEVTTTKSPFCYVAKLVNGMKRYGVINISGDASCVIPCSFSAIKQSEDSVWMVKTKACGDFLPYYSGAVYEDFLDEGERLYERANYKEVERYYAANGSDAPWANFYIGAVNWNYACSTFNDVDSLMTLLRKTEMNDGNDLATEALSVIDKYSLFSSKADESILQYLSSDDKRFVLKAKEIKCELDMMSERMDLMKSDVPRELSAYKERIRLLKEEEKERFRKFERERALKLEEERLRNERDVRMAKEATRRRIALERVRAKEIQLNGGNQKSKRTSNH